MFDDALCVLSRRNALIFILIAYTIASTVFIWNGSTTITIVFSPTTSAVASAEPIEWAASASDSGAAAPVDAAEYVRVFSSDPRLTHGSAGGPFRLLTSDGEMIPANASRALFFSALEPVNARVLAFMEPLFAAGLPEDRRVDFRLRVTTATRQPDVPRDNIERFDIGPLRDSGRCIVTSLKNGNTRYQEYPDITVARLRAMNYSGLYLNYYGHFPFPTGVEQRLLAVPYFMKTAIIIDAYINHGCKKLIWADTNALPVLPLHNLFHQISSGHILGVSVGVGDFNKKFLMNLTRAVLLNMTGRDPVEFGRHVPATVMGFNMASRRVFQLLREFYALAAEGTPFFSCFPEEFPFTMLLKKFDILVVPTPELFGGKGCADCFFEHAVK
jgi:hypothetical protein